MALAITVPAAGQIVPERFENLEVLSADISQGELRGIMQGFATALGVRCQCCHVIGGEGARGLDYRSDAEPNKLKARFTMTRVRNLSDSVLPELPDRGQAGVRGNA